MREIAALLERSIEAEPDDRLRLLFCCAHPSIDVAVRPALMLQVVLGVDVKSMASAFVVSPEALHERLGRAKAKIKANGLTMSEPEPAELNQRLGGLLDHLRRLDPRPRRQPV